MAKGRPTTQAQSAIDALLAAGFKRSEFKVTTERKYYDRYNYEFGDAKISLRASLAKSIELTPAMLAQGLHVSHYYWKAEGEDSARVHMVLVDTDYAKRGELTTYR